MSQENHGLFPTMWDSSTPVAIGAVNLSRLQSYSTRGPKTAKAVLHPPSSEYTKFDPLEYVLDELTAHPETLNDRRAIISELMKVKGNPAAARLLEEIFAFGENHCWLTQAVYDPVYSTEEYPVYTPRIEQYRRDSATRINEGEYKKDDYPVWKLPELLAAAQAASQTFLDQHTDAFPYIAEGVQKQQSSLVCNPKALDVSRYIETGATSLPKKVSSTLHAARMNFIEQTKASLVAEQITKLSLHPVNIHEGPIHLQGLTQPNFTRKTQDPFDIDVGETPIVITGRNGGGKTFGIEALVAALRTGQTTGFASADKGTIPLLHSIDTLSRPGSGHDGLSAFGREIVAWSKVLEAIRANPKNALIIADEPFSGTDAEGQRELIEHITRLLRELGAMAVYTTHSDPSRLVEEGVVIPYCASLGNDGIHRLQPGIGKSDAFEEALCQEFDPEIINRAQALAGGAPLDLLLRETKELPTFRLAEHFNGKPIGYAWFYKQRVSEASDYWRNPYDDYSSGYYTMPDYSVNCLVGNDPVFSRNILHELMTKSGTTSLEIIEVRQEFFEKVAGYKNIEDLQTVLHDFWRLCFSFSDDRFSNGDDRVPEPIVHPLKNTANTFVQLFRDIDAAHSQSYDPSSSELNALREYKLTVIETIMQVFREGDSEDARFIREYTGLVKQMLELSNYNSHQSETIPADSHLREQIYDFFSKVPRKEHQDDGYDYITHELNHIFFWQSWGKLEDGRTSIINEKPRPFVPTDVLRLLVGYGGDDSFGEFSSSCESWNHFTKCIRSQSDKVTPENLHIYADQIDTLYRASLKAAQQRNIIMPARPALAPLRFVAKNEAPIDAIATHLRAIGGDVATDLADYYESTIKGIFRGAVSGAEYAETVKAKTGDRYFVPPLGQISSSWYDKLPPNPLSEIGQLLDLINAAQHIHTNDYGRWGPSSDTEISQLRNVDNRDHTPNDIQAQKGGIEIISGANMSGKTTYLRSLYANHALAASTGWVPAEAMSSPLYERILYVDRPQHDTQKGLSSFGMDIKYWKEITNMLRDAAPSLIVIDEPFSTTSDDYQENLMLATLEWLAQRGHRVVVATHNHNAIKRLEDTGSQEQDGVASITFRHFGTHITESGDVHFTRDLLPGTGESYGLAVARMLGGEAFRQLSS